MFHDAHWGEKLKDFTLLCKDSQVEQKIIAKKHNEITLNILIFFLIDH